MAKKNKLENESEEYKIPLAKRKIVNQHYDPTISSLCDRINDGKIEVRSDFQRKYVWDNKPMIKSKLIESVIKLKEDQIIL